MECWAALSYCRRDLARGPLEPRRPRGLVGLTVTEIRQEVRSHARALGCNMIVGYQERTVIWEVSSAQLQSGHCCCRTC